MRLELRNITKRFPGVVANDSVDLAVESGEILSLLGENGAGKTTLMNILYGLYNADEGEILVDGTPVTFDSPGAAIAAGVGMVHQHFMLVPVFTVTENVVLGVEPTKGLGGRINLAKARKDVTDISNEYGLAVDPDAVIEDLPVGMQQRVEIIKVLFREADVIVFDEPTAVLTPQEVRDFFRILDKLKQDGKAIIFISHKLGEVLEVSDRIAVLRRGAVVGSTTPAETSREDLAAMMVGRPVDLVVDKEPAAPTDTVLDVTDLVVLDDRNHPAVDTISFQARSGEIVGIAGIQGNGQTELVEALTGLRHPLSGTISLDGRIINKDTPRAIHHAGVAHVPEDRQREGLVLDFDLTENLILDAYYDRPFSRGVVVDWRQARKTAEELVEQYDVRTPSVDVQARNLSGGNQQKLIVAREFSRDTRLIVASQPTRGVDVGSIEYIHRRIVEERDDGSAVVIVSSELDEIMALADRIVVMFRGKIVAETTPDKTTTTELGLFMAGTTQ